MKLEEHKKYIINSPGQFSDNLYLIDLKQFGQKYITSAFLYWDGEHGLIMDCGTSDDVGKILRFLKKMRIPLEKIIGICGTHYHFDHLGGSTTLWRRMVKKNPEFKIFVPQDTHDQLQNSEDHLFGAKTTFGDFIGKMPPAPETAFEIVEKNRSLSLPFIDDLSLILHSTPGHCPDHCSPTIYVDNNPIFCFTGEACGSIFHSSKIISVPTSMPPNFKYDLYMKNLDFLDELNPEIIGFCHYGAIENQKAIKFYIEDHRKIMMDLNKEILKAYEEEPSTKNVLDKTQYLWMGRFDERLTGNVMSSHFLKNLRLALTYGQMVDLELREPKYEKRQY